MAPVGVADLSVPDSELLEAFVEGGLRREAVEAAAGNDLGTAAGEADEIVGAGVCRGPPETTLRTPKAPGG
jgi:hypothetical protein